MQSVPQISKSIDIYHHKDTTRIKKHKTIVISFLKPKYVFDVFQNDEHIPVLTNQNAHDHKHDLIDYGHDLFIIFFFFMIILAIPEAIFR